LSHSTETTIMLLRIRGWLRALARRDDVEREMTDEMQLHLERATERLIARGLSPNTARAEALREFGNVAYLQEEARDARGVRWIEELLQDLRFGARSLRKAPAFTAVAVLSLVLGIGVNTAIFTILKVALHPGTIAEPETFVYLPGVWSKPAYDQLRASATAFSAVMARSTEATLVAPRSAGEEPFRAGAELVSDNFFPGLRASIALGRGFSSDDVQPGHAPVAVLNQRFWKAHFDADSNAVGRTFRLASGVTYTVIGVADRDFTGIRRGGPDFWTPYTVRPTMAAVYQMDPGTASWLADAHIGWLDVYGRLAPGHTLEEARAQVELVLRRIAAADSTVAPRLAREPLRLQTAEGGGINNASERLAAAAMLAATLIVLLVACLNVASLMLARATDRQREIAVRLSLGASRGRIIRQLITETMIVAAVGAVVAVVISAWTLRVVAASGGLASVANDEPERLVRILQPDAWVLAFAVFLSAASALVCGLIPALRATRFDLTHAMKSGGVGGGAPTRLRGGLVAGQVALSLVLLVSAGVLLRSFARALALDTGFERARVLSVQTSLRLAGYDSVRSAAYMRTLEERLTALPGVRGVARADVPLAQRSRVTLTTPARDGDAQHEGFFNGVSATFFSTLRIPIVSGRAFTEDEVRTRAAVVVVSEATARNLWGNDDPLGKRVKVAPGGKAAQLSPGAFLASAIVVGVARDAQLTELGHIPPVFAYVPSNDGTLLIRVEGDVPQMVASIRDITRGIDPNALVTATPIAELIFSRTSLSGVQAAAVFAGAIGALALALAAIGIFGLLAYSVSRRTHELGIRRALGARGGDVVALVLRDALRVVAFGSVIGVVVGAAGTRLLRALLFGMSPLDPLAYGGVALVMIVVALIACYVPARRAMRVDPLLALKAE
jgi:macrolide transport system ATP-binding/permease protein